MLVVRGEPAVLIIVPWINNKHTTAKATTTARFPERGVGATSSSLSYPFCPEFAIISPMPVSASNGVSSDAGACRDSSSLTMADATVLAGAMKVPRKQLRSMAATESRMDVGEDGVVKMHCNGQIAMRAS